jgi:hypothetical protein
MSSRFSTIVTLPEVGSSSTPASGSLAIYGKSGDSRLYYKNDLGVEYGPLDALPASIVNTVAGRSGTVVLTATDIGSGTFAGAFAFSSSLSVTAPNGGLEIGALASANTPFIDFHSGVTTTDYDVRLLASGGTGTAGGGTLTITANNVNTSGTLSESGNRVYSLGNKVPVAGLSTTGTASATTFLRGDGSWQVVPTTPPANMATTDTIQTIAGVKNFSNVNGATVFVTSPALEGAAVGVGRSGSGDTYVGVQGTTATFFSDASVGDMGIVASYGTSLRLGLFGSGQARITSTMVLTATRTTSNVPLFQGTAPVIISGNTSATRISVAPSTSAPATPNIDDLWIVNDEVSASGGSSTGGGGEIDYSERNTPFDIQAVGATYTDIEGWQITVPATTQPYRIEMSGLVMMTTGTAAAGTGVAAYFKIVDTTNTSTWAYSSYTAMQIVGGASTIQQGSVFAARRIQPHSTPRTYKVQARTGAAVPTGWSAVSLTVSDAPTQGIYPPAYLRAEYV